MVDVSTSSTPTGARFGANLANARILWRGAAIPTALLAAWFALAHSDWVRSPLLIAPDRVVTLPFVGEAGIDLWFGLAISVVRLIAGFVVGAALGIAFGLLTGMSRTADRAAGPSFNALRQITLFAWIPLMTAWFGNGDTAKIIYIALSAFFPTALNTYEGLRGIPTSYLELAKVLRFSWWQRIRLVLLPGALPSLFIGVQIALISAWIGTVGAEYAMGAGRGIGTFISGGREQFRMDVVLLGVVMLGLVGYGLNVICGSAFRRLLHWQGTQT